MREYLSCHVMKACSRALPSGLAVAMVQNPAAVRDHLGIIPGKRLC